MENSEKIAMPQIIVKLIDPKQCILNYADENPAETTPYNHLPFQTEPIPGSLTDSSVILIAYINIHISLIKLPTLDTFCYINNAGLSFSYTDLSHYGIFFAKWWQNKDGKQPESFTTITLEDVENGNYKPANLAHLEQAKKYLGQINYPFFVY
jgi:hypothetical protein